MTLPLPEQDPPVTALSRHRIPVRFVATLTSNVLSMAVSFFASLMVARGLGPGRYGDLCFLIASFAALAPLLDMGGSSAFYTFLSQGRRGPLFFKRFSVWLLLQLTITLVALSAAPGFLLNRIWTDQGRALLIVAALGGFCANQLWKFVQQIGESARETVLIQAIGAGINIFHAGLMLLLLGCGRMTVASVLVAIIFEYVAAIAWFSRSFSWSRAVDRSRPEPKLGKTLSDYAHYCRPLVLASWAGFLYSFMDRWLLQHFSGSVQQGYFAIAQQFSVVSLIAAASFVNILWKEVAQAHSQGDRELTGRLFLRSSRVLYFVSAALASFAIPYSRDVMTSALGRSYEGAWSTFAILALFPLHQTLGQINGTYFQATGKTRFLFFFAFLAAATSLPLGYWVLAPAAGVLPGLGLKSMGLAVKMVILQAVLVNIQGYVICRAEGWRWPVAPQLGVLCLLMPLSSASFFALSWLPTNAPLWIFVKLCLGGALYFAALTGIVLRFPTVIGVDDETLVRWRQTALQYLRSTN